MADSTRPSLSKLVAELAGAVADLQREMSGNRGRRGRGSGVDRLLRFTTDVTIPATILVLETNLRALGLLQRALRLANESERDYESTSVPTVGRSVVDHIDDALADVQSAVQSSAVNEQTRDQLEEVRELNRQLESRLAELSTDDGDDEGATVDVEAELESIKQTYDDGDDAGDQPEE